MVVVYKEQCKVTREYSINIDVEEFLEWLDGDNPTKEKLQIYIQNECLPWEAAYEEEQAISTELECLGFIELCEEYLIDSYVWRG